MSNTSIAIELPKDFSKNTIPAKKNISHYLQHRKYEELDKIKISLGLADSNSKFGDPKWDLSVYFWRSKKNDSKMGVDFSFLKGNEELTRELKVIAYGWIFHKSGRKTKPAKIQTVLNRISGFKKVYKFLSEEGKSSISSFSNPILWNKFRKYIEDKSYAQSTLEEMFIAFNRVKDLQTWLKIDFNLPVFAPVALAKELSDKEKNQTLAIPERISNEIYGRAIKIVEDHYDLREKLAQTEASIQLNYEKAERVLKLKIQSGVYKFIKSPQDKDYAREVNHHQEKTISSIVYDTLKDDIELPLKPDGNWWSVYFSDLVTACYICMGAFSGMRVDELGGVKVGSVIQQEFNSVEFNIITAIENKLHYGKELTWVCAPISVKAYKLVECLTKNMRVKLKHEGDANQSFIFLTQRARSALPILITGWNERLNRFASKANTKITQADLEECIRTNPNSKELISKYVIVGKYWHITTHQPRRTLAVFASSNHLSSPVAIKQQFKHLYLQMTDWYREGSRALRKLKKSADPEFKAQLNQARLESHANKYNDWFNSDMPLSGSGGKAIMAMRGKEPTIYSSWDTIYKALKLKRLSLHSTLHTHCKNGYNCDMESVVNDAFCPTCSSEGSVIEPEQAKRWHNKHLKLTRYFDENQDLSFQEKLPFLLQIQAAEHVLEDFGIEYEKFPELIEVSVL